MYDTKILAATKWTKSYKGGPLPERLIMTKERDGYTVKVEYIDGSSSYVAENTTIGGILRAFGTLVDHNERKFPIEHYARYPGVEFVNVAEED